MISANDFIPSKYTHSVEHGTFQWSAPSNIALVKYWGKKDNQIPANPSVSLTLNNCKTITKLAFAKKKKDGKRTNQTQNSFFLHLEQSCFYLKEKKKTK